MPTDKPLNIRHLRVFREVAKLRSISAAAQKEFLSQPAVTQAIAKLETVLGVRLFDRRRAGLLVTEVGSVFLTRVEAALEHLRIGARDAIRAGRGREGRGFANFDRLVTAAQLRALVAVSDTSSFSMAARNINVSQPSIHRASRNLERLTGLKLFESAHGAFTMTPAARILAQRCKLALAELRRGLDEVGEFLGREPPEVVIGTLPLARTFILPIAIDEMVKATRRVTIRVVEGPYNELLRGLVHGDFDCLLGALRNPLPEKQVVQEALFEAPLAIVAGKRHPLAGKKRVTISDTFGYPWISPPRSTPAGSYLYRSLSRIGDPEQAIRVISSSLGLVRGLLEAGDYLTMIAPQQVRADLANGNLIRLDIELAGSSRPIGLTYRSGWRPTPVQSQFLDKLREACQSAVEAAASDTHFE